nr:hypothetical protein GCM10020092_034160 [Actinoplanes digitatis]
MLVNRNSGKALDVYNLATNDGARITQWSRNDGSQQQWQFVDSGSGYYRLRSKLSGKVLDVYNWSTADGAAVVQWSDNNAANQQFSVQDIDGYIQLINRNSGKALEVQGASTADGGNIVQYADWNGTNQQWQLVRVGSGTPPSGTFTNPVVWQDFADGDIIRVGDAYYYSASTMHYSPGAPILRSYDLVNWEFAGHSVPRLDFDSNAYDLNGGRAYVKGIWASAFNYRPSDSTYYWLGCTEFNRTYVYASTAIGARLEQEGPDQQVLLRRRPAVRRRHPVRRVRQLHDQRRPALLGPDLGGAVADRLHHPVEHRHARGLPDVQAGQLLLHLADPARRTASTCCARPARGGAVRAASGAPGSARPDLRRWRAAPGRAGADPERRLVVHGVHRRVPGWPDADPGPDQLER